MTEAQAGTLIDRLVAAFDKQLKPDTAALYVEFLVKQAYERTRIGVEKCIEKERFFPTVGTIRRYTDEATFEGQPNSEAYLQDGNRTPWHHKPEAEFLLWRQTQVEAMAFPFPAPGERDGGDPGEAAEERYWAYAHNTDGYKRRCDAMWRREWQRGAA